jgi:hypothetical protein
VAAPPCQSGALADDRALLPARCWPAHSPVTLVRGSAYAETGLRQTVLTVHIAGAVMTYAQRRSRKTSRAALAPHSPVTPPPGWVPAPQR